VGSIPISPVGSSSNGRARAERLLMCLVFKDTYSKTAEVATVL